MDIKERVNQIVRKYGTRNPLEIVKAMDIILVRHPLEGVRGFYHYFQRNHIIYVDERLPENELLFVIAHELGNRAERHLDVLAHGLGVVQRRLLLQDADHGRAE